MASKLPKKSYCFSLGLVFEVYIFVTLCLMITLLCLIFCILVVIISLLIFVHTFLASSLYKFNALYYLCYV